MVCIECICGTDLEIASDLINSCISCLLRIILATNCGSSGPQIMPAMNHANWGSCKPCIAPTVTKSGNSLTRHKVARFRDSCVCRVIEWVRLLPTGRATRHLKQRQIVNNGWTGRVVWLTGSSREIIPVILINPSHDLDTQRSASLTDASVLLQLISFYLFKCPYDQ